MKDKDYLTSIRLRDVYPTLLAFAKAEGKPVSEVVREILRSFFMDEGLEVPERATPTRVDYSGEILTVRWAGLLEPLTDRAISEKTSVAEIVRRAARYYLADMRVKEFKAFRGDIKRLIEIMSRIGGNLNQISLAFNADGIFKQDALSTVHADLRNEFNAFIDILASIRGHLEQQQP